MASSSPPARSKRQARRRDAVARQFSACFAGLRLLGPHNSECAMRKFLGSHLRHLGVWPFDLAACHATFPCTSNQKGTRQGKDMGTNHRGSDKADGVLGLARETADALGRLTVQHLQLARLELKADLRAMGSSAATIIVLGAIAVVGYTLAIAGVALRLGSGPVDGLPFVVIGGAHVVAASIGIVIARVRMRRVRLLNTTAGEVNLSLAPLRVAAAPTGASEP